MKLQIMAGAAAVAFALSMGVANAAFIGSGSDPGYEQHQQQLQTEPGYSLGTGAAEIGDEATPGYLLAQLALPDEPGYSIGTSAAYIGDGSSPNYEATQCALRNMPGVRATEADLRDCPPPK